MNLQETLSMLPGIQVNIPASISATENHIIYSSSNSLFIYQRQPYLQFFKAIQINNVLVSALDANDKYIAVACSDMKVRFYELQGFEPSREVLLAREEAPVSVRFHPRLEDTILILYDDDMRGEITGELKSINYQTGRSFTLVTNLSYSKDLIVSPHREEIAVSARDGMVRLYGIGLQGQVTYQRFLLASGGQQLTVYDKNQNSGASASSQSQFSNKRINLILKCLKYTQKQTKKIPEVVDISYDPFDSDAMLVGWSNGIIAMFSTRTGECLRFFTPRKSLKCLTFSKNKPGIFWTGEQSGVICKWSIGEVECLNQFKIVQDNVERIYGVGLQIIVGAGNGELLLLTEEGKIIQRIKDRHSLAVLDISVLDSENQCMKSVIEASQTNNLAKNDEQESANNKIEQQMCQPRLCKIRPNPPQLVTTSAGGSLYFCSIDAGHININGFLKQSSAYVDSGRMTRLETLQGQAAVCVENYKDLILIGYGNGNIYAYTQRNAMIVGQVVDPKGIEVSYDEIVIKWLNQTELRFNITHIQRPVYSVTDLKCMKLHEEFLFTGWLSGNVRVFRLHYSRAAGAALPTIQSYFVFQFNISEHTTVASTMDTQFVQVNTLEIKDNILYVVCSQGLLILFDITQMLKDAREMQFKDSKQAKLKMSMYRNSSFYCNFPLNLKEGSVLTHKLIDFSLNQFSVRIFTDICVYTPSESEQIYIKQTGHQNVEKVIYLVDNKGYVLVIGQTQGSMTQKTLVILNRFYHEFNSYIIELKKISLGFNCVKKLDENFSILVAGAEGYIATMYWHTGQTKVLESSKSDYTRVLIANNMLIAGCIDGSVKIIQYKYGNKYYISDLIKNMYNSYVENKLMDQNLLTNIFSDNIYQIESLKSSIMRKYDLWQTCPMPVSVLQEKIKVLLYMMIYKISQAIGILMHEIYGFDALLQDVLDIISKYSVQDEQKKQQLSSKQPEQIFSASVEIMGAKISIYNISIDLMAQPSKLYIQEIFHKIIEIGISINKIELLASFLLQIGLINQSAKLSFYVTDTQYKAKHLKDVYQEKFKKNMEPTPADRWNLDDYFPIEDRQFDFLRQIKYVKNKKVISLSTIQNMIKMLISDYKFLIAKLILTQFNDLIENQDICFVDDLDAAFAGNQADENASNKEEATNGATEQNNFIKNETKEPLNELPEELDPFIKKQTEESQNTLSKEHARDLVQRFVTQELTQYHCNVLEPAAAVMEFFINNQIDEGLRLLAFNGDAPIMFFVCQLLRSEKLATNFSETLLHISLFEMVCKHGEGEVVRKLLDHVDQNGEIWGLKNENTFLLPRGMSLGEYYRMHTLRYDNDVANQCYKKLVNKEFDISSDYIAAIHMLNKIISNELYNAEQEQKISKLISEVRQLDNNNQTKVEENIDSFSNKYNYALNREQQVSHICGKQDRRSKAVSDFLSTLLSQIDIQNEAFQNNAQYILFISRYLPIVQQESPNKYSEIHLLLLCSAWKSSTIGHSKAVRSMLSGAFRAAKKGQLRFINILQAAQAVGSMAWYDKYKNNNQFIVQYNGRSAFVPSDQFVFPLLLPISRGMEWTKWFFI